MALTKEDLQAIGELMDGKLAASEQRIMAEMREGFDRLEESINIAAKDASQTEKKLREHIEQTA